MIYLGELIRVFGHPKAKAPKMLPTEAEPIRTELLEELRERLKQAEERERHERERAERYESQLADLRQRHDDLTERLLLPGKGTRGWFGRLFNG